MNRSITKAMVGWSVFVAIVLGIFWLVWYFFAGDVPKAHSFRMVPDWVTWFPFGISGWTLELPFSISRWWDSAAVPVFACGFVFLFRVLAPVGKKDWGDWIVTPVLGFVGGLIGDLFLVWVFGVAGSLAVSFLFGVVIALIAFVSRLIDTFIEFLLDALNQFVGTLGVTLAAGLIFDSRLSVSYGFAGALGFGIALGLHFGFVVGLLSILVFGIVLALAIGLRTFFLNAQRRIL